ncbi:YidH family protein [Sphingomonas mucosissima]|uniref:DUF202 domain-containing protein n=1 Tax=Sphingomonas mucosissima TaxID=370959 RepID=A0A245ZJ97_9SPHN|nr:DUF202 domain-containing protein [Sphingomonas mucosissima]OWK29808.1 hypothetical protein SPMU_22300 [Sphingomonas mucosissima]
MSDDSHDLAKERTDFAEDRTVLAHERSFAGWVRTGMACVGIALGFTALFQALEPVWVPKAIATAFLLIAVFIFWSAERRACGILARLESHTVVTLKPVRIRLLTGALMVTTLALTGTIWWLA